jgi:tagaturonate reductase
MKLTRFTLKNITNTSVVIPPDPVFELPEKVLQFGTGVLLRGLPDYFIDKANRQGVFNGRIVVVKSTNQGDSSAFEKQDGLYTHCIRGIENGEKKEENIINSSISRVLSAHDQWEQILECAHNSHMQIIISNTTEVGIQLIHDDIRKHPPVSFPGKLLAFLYERFRAFGGSAHSGMVIVPTELVPENGKKLESIVLELAHLNSLEEEFIEWIELHNQFCNSLVDRIVPGRPDAEQQAMFENELGYSDKLLTVSEVYCLWAIEGNEHVKNILSFGSVDQGVVVEPDIEKHRELKLRLLNGTHTLSSGVAMLAGCETVKDAMDDELVGKFISQLMLQEIAPAIPYALPIQVSRDFGLRVLDRFRNPHIRHQWSSITLNYSSKLKMRCLPVLTKHYQQTETPPEYIALGFAAYILFMKPVKELDGKYYGELYGESYQIQDEMAGEFFKKWKELSDVALVKNVLKDTELWGYDLTTLPGFFQATLEKFTRIKEHGVKDAIESVSAKKVIAA